MDEFNPFAEDIFVGNKATIRFGNGHPEVTGIVEFIDDKFITLTYTGDTKRFRIDDIVHFEVEIAR